MGVVDSPEALALRALVTIEPEDLAREWLEQPERMLRVIVAAAQAAGNTLRAVAALKTFESTKDVEYRSMTELPGGIKRTDEALKHLVRADPEWARLNEAHAQAIEAEVLFKGLVEEFRLRVESLRYLERGESHLRRNPAQTPDDVIARQVAERVARADPRY